MDVPPSPPSGEAVEQEKNLSKAIQNSLTLASKSSLHFTHRKAFSSDALDLPLSTQCAPACPLRATGGAEFVERFWGAKPNPQDQIKGYLIIRTDWASEIVLWMLWGSFWVPFSTISAVGNRWHVVFRNLAESGRLRPSASTGHGGSLERRETPID